MRLLPLLVLMPFLAHAAPRETRGEFKPPSGDPLPYLLIQPDPSFAAPGRKPPLVVFLHGAGERGNDLEMLKKHGPPKQALTGSGLPFVVLAPQCPQGKWWDPDAVVALTREIIKTHEVDPARVYLTGLSMGGFGTWAILAKTPDLYACGVPICGGGDPSKPELLTKIPLWTFHGEADEAVPVAKTREMEKAVRDAGGTMIRATYYPGVAHDSWTQSYNDPALYAWMMLQSK